MAHNGIGPSWFPQWLREKLTLFGSTFFETASWEHHDFGYGLGVPSRAECDRLFLSAMLKDASNTHTVLRMWICCTLAWTFWAFCRLFGWMTYNYKNSDN